MRLYNFARLFVLALLVCGLIAQKQIEEANSNLDNSQ